MKNKNVLNVVSSLVSVRVWYVTRGVWYVTGGV